MVVLLSFAGGQVMTTEHVSVPRELPRPEGFYIPKSFLEKCFTYAYGNLYWKERPRDHFKSEGQMKSVNTQLAGLRVGYVGKGYLRTNLICHKQSVHSLVYALHYGPFVGIIDHIDGDPFNNHIENLRVTDRTGNVRNRAVRKGCASGLKGAYKSGKYWTSRIGVNGQSIYLGLFRDAQSAHEAYCKAADHYFGEFSCHGR